ncbi:hypothetical protein GCM10011514_35820 [Emticicia aquatilis]|uniref:Uncharacterized protein n=1 Tax=Emticicia aquatilis TaxID=1537369 RepID=A0A916YYY5_9BACT|nr:hypothetical protein [Emticicia aquatilis]GGD68541.1 hypothetical protein GCM10011514_35820 [Emticicia aquatilis]
MLGCIVELFGVRDKAEYDHIEYERDLSDFRNSIFISLKKKFNGITDNKSFEVLFFRDFLYLFTTCTDDLINVLNSLQDSLIKKGLLYRASLIEIKKTEDNVFIFSKELQEFNHSKVTFIKSTHESVLLYSKLLELKGVGINVNLKNTNPDKFLENFWVSQSNVSKNSYNTFIDLKIPQSVLINESYYPTVLSLFKRSGINKKIGVFYIPFYYNILKQLSIKEIKQGEKSIFDKEQKFVYFENYLLSHEFFSNEIHIKGIELIVAVIVSKLFDDDVYTYSSKALFNEIKKIMINSNVTLKEFLSKVESSKIESENGFSNIRLLTNYYFLIKRKWIKNLLSRKISDVPKSTITKSEYNRFLNFCSIIDYNY